MAVVLARQPAPTSAKQKRLWWWEAWVLWQAPTGRQDTTKPAHIHPSIHPSTHTHTLDEPPAST